jgi:hypothetical protein
VPLALARAAALSGLKFPVSLSGTLARHFAFFPDHKNPQ